MQYAMLDATQVSYELERIQSLAPLWLSLYRGPEDAQQEATAPYLAGYEPGDAFADWFWQAEGVGIGIDTDASPDELRKHLRRFLLVELEATADVPGRKVYFRYYDPTILATFLPTCDAMQLTAFFGPVRAFTVAIHQTTQQRLRFTLEQGRLQTKSVVSHDNSPSD